MLLSRSSHILNSKQISRICFSRLFATTAPGEWSGLLYGQEMIQKAYSALFSTFITEPAKPELNPQSTYQEKYKEKLAKKAAR